MTRGGVEVVQAENLSALELGQGIEAMKAELFKKAEAYLSVIEWVVGSDACKIDLVDVSFRTEGRFAGKLVLTVKFSEPSGFDLFWNVGERMESKVGEMSVNTASRGSVGLYVDPQQLDKVVGDDVVKETEEEGASVDSDVSRRTASIVNPGAPGSTIDSTAEVHRH